MPLAVVVCARRAPVGGHGVAAGAPGLDVVDLAELGRLSHSGWKHSWSRTCTARRAISTRASARRWAALRARSATVAASPRRARASAQSASESSSAMWRSASDTLAPLMGSSTPSRNHRSPKPCDRCTRPPRRRRAGTVGVPLPAGVEAGHRPGCGCLQAGQAPVQLDDRLAVAQRRQLGTAHLVHRGPQVIQHGAITVCVRMPAQAKAPVPQDPLHQEPSHIDDREGIVDTYARFAAAVA
ncbi:MAG TPA: hypothetical protein VGR26_14280 [Acidimicrobiales bacterium]|nr:hypothetical protein [Acidimicrobiales bacterium]